MPVASTAAPQASHRPLIPSPIWSSRAARRSWPVSVLEAAVIVSHRASRLGRHRSLLDAQHPEGARTVSTSVIGRLRHQWQRHLRRVHIETAAPPDATAATQSPPPPVPPAMRRKPPPSTASPPKPPQPATQPDFLKHRGTLRNRSRGAHPARNASIYSVRHQSRSDVPSSCDMKRVMPVTIRLPNRADIPTMASIRVCNRD